MKDHITLFLRVPHCKLAIGIVVVEMILIYYVILQNHVIEEYCTGKEPLKVSHHLAMFGNHRHGGSGDIY